MTPKDNFIDICNLTTNVLGLRKGSLSYKSRKFPLHLARLVAGVIGRMDNLKKSKKVFIDRYRMKEYLLKHGVTQSENPQVEIYINSGDIGVTIKTTYFQFSNQFKNIKFALEKYDYKIDWKQV